MSAALVAAVATFGAVWCSRATSAHRVDDLWPRPRRTVSLPVLAAALVPLLTWALLGPFAAAATVVAAPLVRRVVGSLSSREDRGRSEAITRQLPLALDLLSATLAAGTSPSGALAMVAACTPAPLGDELEHVARRLRRAPDPAAIWVTLEGDLAPVGRAFRRAESSGVSVVGLVRVVADEARRSRRAARSERAASVAVRTAGPLGACFLPAFFLIGIVPTLVGSFAALSL